MALKTMMSGERRRRILGEIAGVQQGVHLCAAFSGGTGTAGRVNLDVAVFRPDDRPFIGHIRNDFALLCFRPQSGKSPIIRRDEFKMPLTQMGAPDTGPSRCQNL